MKKEYKINWVLVIVGTMILLSFIIVPPVLRLIDKYNDAVTNNGSTNNNGNTITNDHITCKKVKEEEWGTIEDNILLYNEQDNVSVIARNNTSTYLGMIETDRSVYEEKKTSYANVTGIYYGFEIGEYTIKEEYRITLASTVDLEFLGDMKISSSLTELKEYYNNQDYKCE